MANGQVKWFNAKKGYGFIQQESGTSDIFVHVTALESAGLSDLREGQRLTYEVAMNKGKETAVNIKLIDGDA